MTKEQVFDAKIAPLMTKVIALCKKHKIAMLADFALDAEGLHATMGMLGDECEPNGRQLKCLELLGPRSNPVAMLATRDKDGAIVNMTAILG